MPQYRRSAVASQPRVGQGQGWCEEESALSLWERVGVRVDGVGWSWVEIFSAPPLTWLAALAVLSRGERGGGELSGRDALFRSNTATDLVLLPTAARAGRITAYPAAPKDCPREETFGILAKHLLEHLIHLGVLPLENLRRFEEVFGQDGEILRLVRVGVFVDVRPPRRLG